MPEYLNSVRGVACRACGAVRAPHNEDDNAGLEWSVCANCWGAFRRWLPKDPAEATEDDFNGWLARKLFLELRRREQTGISGRCQAVSDWMYGNRGYQCGLPAMYPLADGHVVCGRHLKMRANKRAFADEGDPHDAYEVLGGIISKLVKKDRKLLDAIAVAIGLDGQLYGRFKAERHAKGSTPIDLTNRVFGKLTALRIDRPRVGKGRHRYWVCRCECGQEKSIRCDALLNGYHLSCGCHRAEASKERMAQQPRDEGGLLLRTLPPLDLS